MPELELELARFTSSYETTMKRIPVLVISLFITLQVNASREVVQEAHAGHAQSRVTQESMQAPINKRFVADASLHQGMVRVRKAVDTLQHLEYGHLDSAQVRATSDEIQAAVDFMFANCKLEPDADAALHPLLARLLTANEALRNNPVDATPLGELRAVIARYPLVFDDSAWGEHEIQQGR